MHDQKLAIYRGSVALSMHEQPVMYSHESHYPYSPIAQSLYTYCHKIIQLYTSRCLASYVANFQLHISTTPKESGL